MAIAYFPRGIRGPLTELTAEFCMAWGKALGRRAGEGAKFVVAADFRPSATERLAALAGGLRDAGADVVDVGVVTLPMLEYARGRLRAHGAAMITPGDAGEDATGLFWSWAGDLPDDEDIVALRHMAETTPAARMSSGRVRTLDVSYDYVGWLQETWVDGLTARLRVVLDPQWGCLGRRARRYLQAIFPNCLFSAVNDEPDLKLAAERARLSPEQTLVEFGHAVQQEGADLGIAFDFGGERLALVDQAGAVLSPEETAALLLKSFGAALAGERFVYDLGLSQRVVKLAAELGAAAHAEPGGPAMLRGAIRRHEAALAADAAGGYYFRALDGGIDALFSSCWLLASLAHSGQTLAELRASCPQCCITPELVLAATDREQVIERLQNAFDGHWHPVAGGLRVETPQGWSLVRADETGEHLAFRFESTDWPALGSMVWHVCETLDDLGDQLWMRYTNLVGNSDHAY